MSLKQWALLCSKERQDLLVGTPMVVIHIHLTPFAFNDLSTVATLRDASFLQRISSLDRLIKQFNSALSDYRPNFSGHLPLPTAEERCAFVVARCIGQVALIQLHNAIADSNDSAFAQGINAQSYAICLRAARTVAAIIRELSEEDIDFLDPIIGVRFLTNRFSTSSNVIVSRLHGSLPPELF